MRHYFSTKRWLGSFVLAGLVMAGLFFYSNQNSNGDVPKNDSLLSHNHLSSRLDVVADAWSKQFKDGGFVDPISKKIEDTYGQSYLAWFLLQQSNQQKDAATQIQWRQIANSILQNRLRWVKNKGSGAFEQWVFASIYSQSIKGQNSSLLYPETKTLLMDYLQTMGPTVVGKKGSGCHKSSDCYNNIKLLNVLTTLVLKNNDLAKRGFVPHKNSRAYGGKYLKSVNGVVNGLEKQSQSFVYKNQKLQLLSDPSRHPLAYHHLTATFLINILQTKTLDAIQTKKVETVLWKMMRLSCLMNAPDGDFTFYGRGQGQIWVPSTILFNSVWGLKQTTSPVMKKCLSKMANQAWQSIKTDFNKKEAKNTLPVIPSLRFSGTDPYANQTVYNGLSLVMLRQALQTMPKTVLNNNFYENAIFHEPNTGNLILKSSNWFAAWQTKSRHNFDSRYASGFLTVKARENSTWKNLIPHRPFTEHLYESGIQMIDKGKRVNSQLQNIKADKAGISASLHFENGEKARLRISLGANLNLSLKSAKSRKYSMLFWSKTPNVSQTLQSFQIGDLQVIGNKINRISTAEKIEKSSYEKALYPWYVVWNTSRLNISLRKIPSF